MKSILLVDDGPDRSTIIGILNRLGHEVINLRDTSSALCAINAGARVDLVITDCRTNGADCLDFLASLKKVAPAVPSIMLSANGSIETYLKACNLGVYEYLNKPVKTKEIIRIVQAALEKAAGFDPPDRLPYRGNS